MRTWIPLRTRWFVAPFNLATASITAAGASPDVSVGDVSVVEGNAGDRSLDIPVSLSQAAPGAVTVAYATNDGTAGAGVDYRAATGAVTFAPGELIKWWLK